MNQLNGLYVSAAAQTTTQTIPTTRSSQVEPLRQAEKTSGRWWYFIHALNHVQVGLDYLSQKL